MVMGVIVSIGSIESTICISEIFRLHNLTPTLILRTTFQETEKPLGLGLPDLRLCRLSIPRRDFCFPSLLPDMSLVPLRIEGKGPRSCDDFVSVGPNVGKNFWVSYFFGCIRL